MGAVERQSSAIRSLKGGGGGGGEIKETEDTAEPPFKETSYCFAPFVYYSPLTCSSPSVQH